MRIIIVEDDNGIQVYTAGASHASTFEVVKSPERLEQLGQRFALIKAEDMDGIRREIREDILDRFPLVPPEALNEKRIGIHKSLDLCYHNGLLFCDMDRRSRVDAALPIRLMRTSLMDPDRALLLDLRMTVGDLLIAYKENRTLFKYRIPDGGIKTAEDVLILANAIDWHVGLRRIKIHGGSE